MKLIAFVLLLAAAAAQANPTTTIGGRTAEGGVVPAKIDSEGYFGCFDHATDKENGAKVVEQGQFDYETVAASQTDQALGATGGVGDYIHKLIITVGTAATAAVSIEDGSGSNIPILPNSPGGGIGVYVVEINAVSTLGAWEVTTGAGSTVLAIGRFTP